MSVRSRGILCGKLARAVEPKSPMGTTCRRLVYWSALFTQALNCPTRSPAHNLNGLSPNGTAVLKVRIAFFTVRKVVGRKALPGTVYTSAVARGCGRYVGCYRRSFAVHAIGNPGQPPTVANNA